MDHANEVWRRPALAWETCQPEPAELAAAEREAAGGDAFDRLNLKNQTMTAVKRGSGRILCRRLGTLARVLCVLPSEAEEPEWEFWARIFQWFGQAANKQPWRVTYYAAAADRRFPAGGQDLGPEHVNGGYTRPCSTEGIFIYRDEESTRVLIHELVHAACLDEQEWPIPLREAQVEVWAELILVALRSRGVRSSAIRLWVKQSHWVADGNWKAQAMHGTKDISDYAWRYLVGREQMYARLGVALPAGRPPVAKGMQSLRFTHPVLGQ